MASIWKSFATPHFWSLIKFNSRVMQVGKKLVPFSLEEAGEENNEICFFLLTQKHFTWKWSLSFCSTFHISHRKQLCYVLSIQDGSQHLVLYSKLFIKSFVSECCLESNLVCPLVGESMSQDLSVVAVKKPQSFKLILTQFFFQIKGLPNYFSH